MSAEEVAGGGQQGWLSSSAGSGLQCEGSRGKGTGSPWWDSGGIQCRPWRLARR